MGVEPLGIDVEGGVEADTTGKKRERLRVVTGIVGEDVVTPRGAAQVGRGREKQLLSMKASHTD